MVVVDFERWAEVPGDLPPEVMTVVCGHTHLPFTRLANTRQIINPGSVGMPYGRQGAHWALLSGGAVEMRRTSYDPVAACAAAPSQRHSVDTRAGTAYVPPQTASTGPASFVLRGRPAGAVLLRPPR